MSIFLFWWSHSHLASYIRYMNWSASNVHCRTPGALVYPSQRFELSYDLARKSVVFINRNGNYPGLRLPGGTHIHGFGDTNPYHTCGGGTIYRVWRLVRALNLGK